MKIGFCVEGAVDRAFIRGLGNRFCPRAELEAGEFRGKTGLSLRRELEKMLSALFERRDCNYVVVLTDSNDNAWNTVFANEWPKVPQKYWHKTIYGVAERNIECWIRLDRNDLAKELHCNVDKLNADDPSDFVKNAFGFGSGDNITAEERIANFVKNANLRIWRDNSRSFSNFVDQIREKARQEDCNIAFDA